MSEITYTAVATSTAEGRNGGRATSDDGMLDVTLAVPKAFGGAGDGTNPEQLFAAGWASCFVGAVRRVASARKVTAHDLAVIAEVTLHHDSETNDFTLSAVLHLEASGIDQATADELVQGAHLLCPYSKATRGNIEVTLDATVA
ncbi:osmotically inducible protein C [Sphaerisporangium melleum]|uniref:Osmotically inducible protein C n=1 Tax=Sphaerisporangium melleum TaxID=321316 RepID=A0A917RFZ3_9ACTN|nr:organic hydroperoxide resistance protein [Sphaerisporangium melleum]GGL04486.1 osmotically inducible protein C [Sphaerisporangium melleum]GII74121.1 osmotically inducible protein C [Sphaerisporangium melleum]